MGGGQNPASIKIPPSFRININIVLVARRQGRLHTFAPESTVSLFTQVHAFTLVELCERCR
jgi:hypothetical protein